MHKNTVDGLAELLQSIVRLIDVLDHQITVSYSSRDNPSGLTSDSRIRQTRWNKFLNVGTISAPGFLARLFESASILLETVPARDELARSVIELAGRIWTGQYGAIAEFVPTETARLQVLEMEGAASMCTQVLVQATRLLVIIKGRDDGAHQDAEHLLRTVLRQNIIVPARHRYRRQQADRAGSSSSSQARGNAGLAEINVLDEMTKGLQDLPVDALPRAIGAILEISTELEKELNQEPIRTSSWLETLFDRLLELNIRSARGDITASHSKEDFMDLEVLVPDDSSNFMQWENIRVEPTLDSFARLVRTMTCQHITQEASDGDLGAALSYCAAICYADIFAAIANSRPSLAECSIGSHSGHEAILLSVARLIRRVPLPVVLSLMVSTTEMLKEASLTDDDSALLFTVLHFVILGLPAQATADSKDELRECSRAALQAITNRLERACPAPLRCLLFRSAMVLIRDRRYAANQTSLGLLADALEVQYLGIMSQAEPNLREEGLVFIQLCRLTHRLSLTYLYHLNGPLVAMIPLVILLMRVLFKLSNAFQRQSRMRCNDKDNATISTIIISGARAYGNVLVLLSDPPAPQMRRPNPGSQSEGKSRPLGLLSLQDQARHQSQRCLPPVLMHYVKEEHNGPLRAEEKEALSSGTSSLLKCLRLETKTVFAALREGERELLGIMLTEWKRRR